MTTREKVYIRLGLPLGSLKSESGNDWQRALKEVEEDERGDCLNASTYTHDKSMDELLMIQKERHNKAAAIINDRWDNKNRCFKK